MPQIMHFIFVTECACEDNIWAKFGESHIWHYDVHCSHLGLFPSRDKLEENSRNNCRR